MKTKPNALVLVSRNANHYLESQSIDLQNTTMISSL